MSLSPPSSSAMGRFLLVEEETSQGLRYNQPAGHLEADESLVAAVVRETLEESAYHFVPQHLLGIYRWHSDESDTTYLRFAFTGKITGHEPDRNAGYRHTASLVADA